MEALPAAPLQRAPWMLALGGSVLLHAVGMAGWTRHPSPPRVAPATVSIFSVRLPQAAAGAPPTALAATRPAQAPAPSPSVRPRRSRTTHPAAAATAPPSPPDPVGAPTAEPTAPPPATAEATPAPAPVTAGLFSPLTSEPLGQGGWGRRRSRQSPDDEVSRTAWQAQQPQVLQAMLQSRLAAMGEVMRQNQQPLDCDIRLDTHTRHAEVRCHPEPMHDVAWGALQGLATPGPLEATAGPLLLCLHWTSFEVLLTTCVDTQAPPPAPASSP